LIVRRVRREGRDQLLANNTIVVFSTDNGAERFTRPDGGMTPFRR
jgi:arylsulfatase A-like enzyme